MIFFVHFAFCYFFFLTYSKGCWEELINQSPFWLFLSTNKQFQTKPFFTQGGHGTFVTFPFYKNNLKVKFSLAQSIFHWLRTILDKTFPLSRGDVDAARNQYMTILHRYLYQQGEDVENKVGSEFSKQATHSWQFKIRVRTLI